MTYPILVLNEPHASIEGLYDNELSFWNIDARFINEVVFRLTDWHTDFLFHGFRDARVRPVRFPYSRFVVDAERLWNDPLEQEGQGILYRRFGGYCRTIPQQCEARLYDLWRGHQHNLKRALCENALLLDCHSFPEEQGDVDICIGFNDDWYCAIARWLKLPAATSSTRRRRVLKEVWVFMMFGFCWFVELLGRDNACVVCTLEGRIIIRPYMFFAPANLMQFQ